MMSPIIALEVAAVPRVHREVVEQLAGRSRRRRAPVSPGRAGAAGAPSRRNSRERMRSRVRWQPSRRRPARTVQRIQRPASVIRLLVRFDRVDLEQRRRAAGPWTPGPNSSSDRAGLHAERATTARRVVALIAAVTSACGHQPGGSSVTAIRSRSPQMPASAPRRR